jgi:hypothetical protein
LDFKDFFYKILEQFFQPIFRKLYQNTNNQRHSIIYIFHILFANFYFVFTTRHPFIAFQNKTTIVILVLAPHYHNTGIKHHPRAIISSINRTAVYQNQKAATDLEKMQESALSKYRERIVADCGVEGRGSGRKSRLIFLCMNHFRGAPLSVNGGCFAGRHHLSDDIT